MDLHYRLCFFCGCITVAFIAVAPEETTSREDGTGRRGTDSDEVKNELRELWKERQFYLRQSGDYDFSQHAIGSHQQVIMLTWSTLLMAPKKRDEELDRVMKTFERRIKEIDSNVIKPQHWMLEFFDQINVALVNRKYKYMRAKRDEIQEVMNEAYGFIALTALTSPGHLDDGQVCTEKGLSSVINEFIRNIHQTPLEVIKIVKLLRVRLLKYFYKAGTWDEQIAADLYTFFKLMIGSRNRFDEMAAEVELKWEGHFEETRKQVIRICHVEVGEVEERIHEAIGDSWDKLNDTSDSCLNEDELLEGVLGPLEIRGPEPDTKEYPKFSSSPRPIKERLEIPMKKTEPHTHNNEDDPPEWHIRLFNTVSP